MAGFSIKAQAVLQVYDDFTGLAVARGLVRLILPQGGWSVEKEDGIFVLGGCGESPFDIRLASPLYEEYSRTLSPFEGDCPYLKIPLAPSPWMPVSEGTTLLEGYVPQKSRVLFVCENPELAMKLLKDSQKQTVQLYHGKKQNMSGRLAAFYENGEFREIVRIREEEDNGTCHLETPLASDYKRVGTSVYPVREVGADDKGYYCIWLSAVPQEGCFGTLILKKENEDIIRERIRIESGIRNRRDETWDFACAEEP